MDVVPKKGPQVICSGFIEKEGKFLIFLCPKFRVWRVPGGRAENNEKLEDTFIREMEEEIGITVKNPRFLGYGQDNQHHFGKQKDTDRLLMFYHVKIKEEPTIDTSEADEHKWVTLDELKNINDKEGALTEFFEKNPDNFL